MHIGMYLDEADHVGIDDQPFYYGGMLNVFKMRSNLVRMDLKGGESLTDGEAAFTKASERLRSRGGGTISIYYHPNEWVHGEFWDAVNFSHGANPPRDAWKQPRMRPAAETEQAFADFRQWITFIKAQPGVRFVTATDLMSIYADRARDRDFGRADVIGIARAMQSEITFQRQGDYAISAADAFGLLTNAMTRFIDTGTWPAAARISPLDGPAHTYVPSLGARSTTFTWPAFALAVRDTVDACQTLHRIPDEIWVGAESLSPADYLATLAQAVQDVASSGRAPAEVVRRTGRFTADRYVAEDTPALWSWPIFPDGFHAPRIMEQARLQAWTLKPALLGR
jgi:hypothetical protein